MPISRHLPACLLILGLGALLCCPLVAQADPPAAVPVPETRPVQLDGRALHGEWSDAAELAGTEGGGQLLVQRFRGTLLLGLRNAPGWPTRGKLVVYIAPAEGLGAPGAISIDYEPYEHNRPHLLATRASVGGMHERIEEELVCRSVVGPGGSSLELAIPLETLGIDSAEPAERRLVAFLGGTQAGVSASWPPGLSLRGPRGAPPPDLQTTDRWARLTDLAGAGGPGAFSESQWETWRAEDTEVQQLGSTAHARAYLLEEEASNLPKDDGTVETEVFEGFRKLARLERLTGVDLLAMAQAHRYMNQYERAIGILEGLRAHPDPAVWGLAEYRLALCHRAAGRFADEQATWESIAARPGLGAGARRYQQMAAAAAEREAAWQDELRARQEDALEGELPRVRIQTVRGDVELVLYERDAPEAVARFLEHVEAGDYDGTRFHRVIGAGLAQGGDPASRIACPFPPPEKPDRHPSYPVNERHAFFRGTLAFAGDATGATSVQFFVLTHEKLHLAEDGFTALGHVVMGMEAIDRIEACDLIYRARRVRTEAPPEPPAEEGVAPAEETDEADETGEAADR